MASTPDGEAIEQIADTFPLSRWVKLARLRAFASDGMPVSTAVNWDDYTVEIVMRRVTSPDEFDLSHSVGFRVVGGHTAIERNPDGSLKSFEMSGGEVWRHVRTIIRHPDVVARLEWRWDGTASGSIGIVGLETDPDSELSCRHLTKAIPLLRDWEWRGTAKAGPREYTDQQVRADLKTALDRCQNQGQEHPSLRQLADAHDRRRGHDFDEVGISEATLTERMRKHPGPFRDLVPWIPLRPKR